MTLVSLEPAPLRIFWCRICRQSSIITILSSLPARFILLIPVSNANVHVLMLRTLTLTANTLTPMLNGLLLVSCGSISMAKLLQLLELPSGGDAEELEDERREPTAHRPRRQVVVTFSHSHNGECISEKQCMLHEIR